MAAAAGAWQPSAEGLSQLVQLLASSQSADNQTHRAIQQQLTAFNAIPDFNNYLTYILFALHDQPGAVRQMAGLVLKNNVKEHWDEMHPSVQAYVKQGVLACVGLPEPYLRQTAGTCVTTIAYTAGLAAWTELVPTLLGMLEGAAAGGAHDAAEGAIAALSKVCEDSCEALATQPESQPMLGPLLSTLIPLINATHEPLRRHALSCIVAFIPLCPEPLDALLPSLLAALDAVKGDPAPAVRRLVCQALVMLLDVAIQTLEPAMPALIDFMLSATADADEMVAIEACEFWSALCETGCAKQALPPCLPRLVPLLLRSMVYSAEEREELRADGEEDAEVADRPEEIRPRFAKSKHGVEEEEEGEGEVAEWSVRKCAASGLDVLAATFGAGILPHLLPELEARLSSEDWPTRESAILALGAISAGCEQAVAPFLPQLAPWLIGTLDHNESLVRSITCWTLSRYSRWLVEQRDISAYLEPLAKGLLARVLDRNKKVQEAACSALATLEEEAQQLLAPWLDEIIATLLTAYQRYQAKNLLILYDAIGTLADAVGSELCQPRHIDALMPPLLSRWSCLADDDRSSFPLLVCLTSIAQALGLGFQPFAQPVFERCVRIIQGVLAADAAYDPEGEAEPPDRDFLVCALDLLSGLADGLGQSLEPLVAGSTLPSLLLTCMRLETPDVRQSAFALLGDLAKACHAPLLPVLDECLGIVTKALDPEFNSVCNNASWAIGEITVKIGGGIAPYVPPILQHLILIVSRPTHEVARALLENTAITIGRLGMVAPQAVAPMLETFAGAWLLALRGIRDDIEKEHAFRGLVELVRVNPAGVMGALPALFAAIGSWDELPPDLAPTLSSIAAAYKAQVPAEAWPAFYASFPEHLRRRLTDRHAI